MPKKKNTDSPTAKSLPQKGIHVQSAMGWLTRRLFQEPDAPVPFAYDGAGPHHFGGGSENMKLLYAVCGYVAGAEDGHERLLNWHRSEEGHGGGEPITVSHGQLHLGGHASAALHAFRQGDAEILDHAVYWLQVEYALLSACEVDGEPWTPGARGVQKDKIVGENDSRGKFVAAVRRGQAPKLDKYFLGALAVAALPAPVRDLIAKPPQRWPSIQGGLTIQRYADGRFWAAFDNLPIGGGGVRAGGFDGRERWLDREGGKDRIARYAGNPVHVISLPEHVPGKGGNKKPPKEPVDPPAPAISGELKLVVDGEEHVFKVS